MTLVNKRPYKLRVDLTWSGRVSDVETETYKVPNCQTLLNRVTFFVNLNLNLLNPQKNGSHPVNDFSSQYFIDSSQ